MKETSEDAAQRLSDVLRRLPRGRAVTLGDTLGSMGARAHGCALLLLALPDAMPLPLPSLSAVLAVPLILITVHLAAFGAGRGLPPRLDGMALPVAIVGTLRDHVAPLLRRAERLSHPRWQALACNERLLALVCLYLSALLILPLPFFNAPPALCLVLLALGMVQRDGLFVLAGLAGTVLITIALGWLAGRFWQFGATSLPGLA